jgi:hypothetical protein
MRTTYVELPRDDRDSDGWNRQMLKTGAGGDGWGCECQVCDAARTNDYDDKPLIFDCGGEYRLTVNTEGQPVWAGFCGKKPVQRTIQFTEEEEA